MITNRERIEELRNIERRKQEDLKEIQNRFDLTLKNVYNDPWWRQFIKLIKERRQMLSEQLESGLFESRREEERARGQISELKLILSLDKYSEQLQNPVKDKRDGTQV